jgi:antitoxin CptB
MHGGPIDVEIMDQETRLKRLKFRSWHRGTKEADLMIGGFFDARHIGWSAADIDWFEAFLEEQDVDIMAWAIGTAVVPDQWKGAMIEDLKRLDFISIPQ